MIDMLDYELSIEKELNKSLKERIVQHKERFIRIFKARYLEVLPSLIKYNNADPISVDFMKVEVALRNGYDVVIGETANRTIQVIGYATSNFIVLRNKTLNYVLDYNILDHYIDELAEIVLSRYSISMQVKITTLFLGEPNDETLNQIISDVYNGNPYIRGSKLFDPEEQI